MAVELLILRLAHDTRENIQHEQRRVFKRIFPPDHIILQGPLNLIIINKYFSI